MTFFLVQEWLKKKFRVHRWEILLAVVALLIYLPGITWGLPYATSANRVSPWGHDDITPLGPLSEFHSVLTGDKEHRYLNYPLMQYGALAVAYSPYLLYLRMTDGMKNASPGFPFGLRDPAAALRSLTLIARFMTLLMAAGIVVAAYHLGRSLWGQVSGVLSGFFVMLLFPMVYYSRTGNLDVPALFWGAAGLAVYARILREGYTLRRGIWLGALAAFSAGTKDQNAGLFLMMPLVLIPIQFRRVAGDSWRARWMAPAATVIAGVLVYILSSGLVLSPERFVAHVYYVAGVGPGSTVLPNHPATLAGFLAVGREIWDSLASSMGGLMFAAALAGVILAAWRDQLSLALLIPAISLIVAFVLPIRYVQMRFLLPVSFVFACLASLPLGLGLRSRHAVTRVVCVVCVAAIGVVGLLRGADLTYAMLRDSRYAAANWLDAQGRPGDRVGFFGPDQKLPRVKAELEYVRVVPFLGTYPGVHYSPAEIDEMARSVDQSATEFLLVLTDHSMQPGLPYGSTCPPALYDRLRDGSLGYRLVARIETPPLFPWVHRPSVIDYPVVDPPVEIFERVSPPTSLGRPSRNTR